MKVYVYATKNFKLRFGMYPIHSSLVLNRIFTSTLPSTSPLIIIETLGSLEGPSDSFNRGLCSLLYLQKKT